MKKANKLELIVDNKDFKKVSHKKDYGTDGFYLFQKLFGYGLILGGIGFVGYTILQKYFR